MIFAFLGPTHTWGQICESLFTSAASKIQVNGNFALEVGPNETKVLISAITFSPEPITIFNYSRQTQEITYKRSGDGFYDHGSSHFRSVSDGRARRLNAKAPPEPTEVFEKMGFGGDPNKPGLWRGALWGSPTIAVVKRGKVQFFQEPKGGLSEILRSIKNPEFENLEVNGQRYLKVTSETLNFLIDSYGTLKESSVEMKVPLEEIGINFTNPKETLETDSNFVVSGQNTNANISSLKSLTGIPLEELEQRLRPGKASFGGFLGKTESLLEVLIHDNTSVFNSGLTHQKIGRELLLIRDMVLKNLLPTQFIWHGRKFEFRAFRWKSAQFSPFSDGTFAGHDIYLKNIENGMEITFSALIPDLIYRYGFYEGLKSPYRVTPKKIIQVLDFLTDPN